MIEFNKNWPTSNRVYEIKTARCFRASQARSTSRWTARDEYITTIRIFSASYLPSLVYRQAATMPRKSVKRAPMLVRRGTANDRDQAGLKRSLENVQPRTFTKRPCRAAAWSGVTRSSTSVRNMGFAVIKLESSRQQEV